jgi:hypothetical protein
MTWQKTTNHDGLDHRWNRRGTVKAWLTRFPCTAATFRDHPSSAARRAWWLVRARAWCCRRQVDQWMTCSMRWTGAMAAVRRRRISLRVKPDQPGCLVGRWFGDDRGVLRRQQGARRPGRAPGADLDVLAPLARPRDPGPRLPVHHGGQRAILGATQPRRSSSPANQREGSTLWPAASARSSCVHTTKILERWPHLVLVRHARYVTKCRCRTRAECAAPLGHRRDDGLDQVRARLGIRPAQLLVEVRRRGDADRGHPESGGDLREVRGRAGQVQEPRRA